jgi:tRNA 5-methylaminomethyl-2-thiouridine biosynthesis bifunctional protein
MPPTVAANDSADRLATEVINRQVNNARAIDYWAYAPSLNFSKRSRAIVIGGGIAGTTTAHALAQRGCEVKLLEKENTLAHGASGNPQGVLYTKLSPQAGVLNRFALASYLFALEFYRPFVAENSAAGELCGVLQYADNEAQWQQLQTAFANHDDWVQFVDAPRASELANCTIAQPSLWFPRAGWIAPAIICEHLAQHPLIELHTNCTAKTIEPVDNIWRIECYGVVFEADVVVIANANSAQCFSQTAQLPLKPIRGQITELPARYLREQPRAVICHTGYLSPAANGVHIGATFDLHENDLTDTALRAEDHRHNLQALHNALPELLNNADAIVTENLQGRVGYRCATPDYLPIIGVAAEAPTMRQRYAKLAKNAHAHIAETGAYLPGLYINAGHGSRGLTSAPLCAELLAALIAGEPRPLPRDLQQALSPARFLLRDLIRGH